jgi:hypothetical protein
VWLPLFMECRSVGGSVGVGVGVEGKGKGKGKGKLRTLAVELALALDLTLGLFSGVVVPSGQPAAANLTVLYLRSVGTLI